MCAARSHNYRIPNDGVDVGDLATGLDDVVLGLVDDRVGGVLVLEPDDGRLGLVNTEDTGDHGEGGNDESEGAHVGEMLLFMERRLWGYWAS